MILDTVRLKHAIDIDDLDGVRALMTRNPALHKAPMGYGNNGPLTWAAECRGQLPTPARLDIADWMIANGSDVHQGGDGPLMRAALSGDRVPMMELLVANGADVNAAWNGDYPIIFAACESVDPVALDWLLGHGANPDTRNAAGRDSALDYVLGSYVRTPRLAACIELLVAAGAPTRCEEPAVLDLLRNRLDLLAAHLDADATLIHRHFPQLTFGTTGGRMLTLAGGTLLHVAAEFLNLEAARMLLERGAGVNAPALVANDRTGGQTPIFHAATQQWDLGLPMVELLLAHNADLTVRARVPGHYEKPGEILECTAPEYSARFADGYEKTAKRLRSVSEAPVQAKTPPSAPSGSAAS